MTLVGTLGRIAYCPTANLLQNTYVAIEGFVPWKGSEVIPGNCAHKRKKHFCIDVTSEGFNGKVHRSGEMSRLKGSMENTGFACCHAK